jgi:hypothetical protein
MSSHLLVYHPLHRVMSCMIQTILRLTWTQSSINSFAYNSLPQTTQSNANNHQYINAKQGQTITSTSMQNRTIANTSTSIYLETKLYIDQFQFLRNGLSGPVEVL